MDSEQITLLRGLRTKSSGNHSLYYYQGNFYQPLSLVKKDKLRADRAVRLFKIDNKLMIEKDKADPDYKTLVEIFDDQYPNG